MRIGIDARELCGRPTGVGRYLNGLLAEWAVDNQARGHEFVLYAPETLAVTLDARRFATRIVPGPGGTWWEQVRLPAVAAKDHLDVLFAPGYTAPLLRTAPTVVAIHDLSFAAHPEWFGVREGIRRRWLSRQSAERARAVITISEFSRRELTEQFGLAESEGSRDSSRDHVSRDHDTGNLRPWKRPVRRFDLQSSACTRSDSSLRADRASAPAGVSRDRRRRPQLSRVKI